MKDVALSSFTKVVMRPYIDPVAGATDILIVGGLQDFGGADALCPNDERYTNDIVRLGGERGLRFNPNPRLRLCTGPRTDFLKEQAPACGVVFAKICFDSTHTHQHQVIDRRMCWQSPLAQDPDAWLGALVATNASWAVNVHKKEIELPTEFIARPPFRQAWTYQAHDGVIYDFLVRCTV